MSNLQVWEDKIKAKRMKTPFRGFIKEVASWCPAMLYRNQWNISRYDEKIGRIQVVDNSYYSNNYETINAQSFAEWNESQKFSDQFRKVYSSYQFPCTYQFLGLENCEFSDVTHASKNAYLSFFVTTGAENVLYSYNVKQNSKNIFNSISIGKNSENIYQSKFCLQSFNIYYSYNVHDSANTWFSSNLAGCHECIGCDNLQNQSYCIGNKSYQKEEYFTKKREILWQKSRFSSFHEKVFHNKCVNFASENTQGYCIYNSHFVTNWAFCGNLTNGNNAILIFSEQGVTDAYDSISWGSWDTHNIIGQTGGGLCDNIYLSIQCWTCSHIYYSQYLENCSFCLGCIGLKNKSYCILNKQYTKEEWYELADKIFTQMDKEGTLGDFFPWNLNPFYFNDTAAYLIDDSFTKEEVEKEWYLWRDEAIKVDIPEGADIIETKDLNQYQWYDTDGNWTIQEDILSKVIRDEKGNFYKIVPMELEFLQKHHLPLPEIHWLERIKMGFRM